MSVFLDTQGLEQPDERPTAGQEITFQVESQVRPQEDFRLFNHTANRTIAASTHWDEETNSLLQRGGGVPG